MMKNLRIRDVNGNDFQAILQMNQESVEVLSPLDADRLARLVDWAKLFRVVERDGEVLAFLIGLPEGCSYDSLNYRWFADRYDRFLYIDRVVVRADSRDLGLGSWLYSELLTVASRQAIPWLTCEIDLEPPNRGSLRFHARLGFQEVGQLQVPGRGKIVSLQARSVVPAFLNSVPVPFPQQNQSTHEP